MHRIAVALVLTACALHCIAEEAFGLPALMQALAQVPAAEARFTEVRRMHILRVPIELQGTLRYVRPDKLERRVLSPYEETIVIEGNQVSVDSPARGERRSCGATRTAPSAKTAPSGMAEVWLVQEKPVTAASATRRPVVGFSARRTSRRTWSAMKADDSRSVSPVRCDTCSNAPD